MWLAQLALSELPFLSKAIPVAPSFPVSGEPWESQALGGHLPPDSLPGSGSLHNPAPGVLLMDGAWAGFESQPDTTTIRAPVSPSGEGAHGGKRRGCLCVLPPPRPAWCFSQTQYQGFLNVPLSPGPCMQVCPLASPGQVSTDVGVAGAVLPSCSTVSGCES